MQIKVTQEHIDKGVKGVARKCPIALALKEATHLNASIWLQIHLKPYDWQSGDSYEYDGLTPPDVFRKLQYFDLTKEMQPFTFEIDYAN